MRIGARPIAEECLASSLKANTQSSTGFLQEFRQLEEYMCRLLVFHSSGGPSQGSYVPVLQVSLLNPNWCTFDLLNLLL